MNISRNFSVYDTVFTCAYVYTAWSLTSILLLPVFMFVIYVGFQWCRKPRSRASTVTHSDVFTFNMAALEVIRVLGYFLMIIEVMDYTFISLSLYVISQLSKVYKAAVSLNSMTEYGQTLFHTFVCLERYLAVVHPITYLHLKKNGVVIRNVSIAVVWLFSFGMAWFSYFKIKTFNIFLNTTGALSLVTITYFCARVLHVLIRPGPGERGGDRKRIDQSKRRAFRILVAVTVAVLLKFVPFFVMYTIFIIYHAEYNITVCLLATCSQWFSIPSSLVMPLLFIYQRHKRKKNPP